MGLDKGLGLRRQAEGVAGSLEDGVCLLSERGNDHRARLGVAEGQRQPLWGAALLRLTDRGIVLLLSLLAAPLLLHLQVISISEGHGQ